MDSTSMTPADFSAMMGNNEGFGGNGGFWLIILFLFFMNGGWGGMNRNQQDAYTQSQALMDTNFNNLNTNVQSIANRQYEQANNLTKGLADGFYSELQAVNGLQTNLGAAITTEGRTLQSQLANCCCENRLAIANLSAQTDQQTAALTTAIHAEGEQTRALIQTNEIQALRDKVSTLEADNRMAGVVRYPMAYTYASGANPFCNCGNSNI